VQHIEIYADGACRGNPGPGGFGVIVKRGDEIKELNGSESQTTNNRMEVMGVIMGLKEVKSPSEVLLVSDSQYLVKAMTEWIHDWQKRGWMTSGKKPVKNRDLWEELIKLAGPHKIKWKWIKGHNGHPENERCDVLANMAIDKLNNR
jgi:ribonuclease HI